MTVSADDATQRVAYSLPRPSLPGAATVGWLVVLGLGLVALLGPLLVSADPQQVDLANSLAAPDVQHLLGTDSSGRDVLARLVEGTRTSLLGPLLVVALSTLVGVPLGLLAGFRSGVIDTVLSRSWDVMFAFPPLLLAIVMVATFGPGFWTATLAIAAVYVPLLARVVRGVTVAERQKPYIEAGRVQGFSNSRIACLHLLPNIAPTIAAQATLNFGYALLDLAGLAFLGLGVQPPRTDWGAMLVSGRDALLLGSYSEVIAASVAIAVTVVAFNVAGTALMDLASGETSGPRPQRKPRRPAKPSSTQPRTPDGALLEISKLVTELPVGDRLKPVVCGVNLQLARGEILGVVGESGSGKSMTARTIMRLLPAGARTSGQARLAGVDLLSLDQRRLRLVRSDQIAMIFQDPRAHVDPLYPAGDHLTEGLRARGLSGSAARRRALELLDAVGISDGARVLRSYPGELSGGMLQRVMIAGALTTDPQLLIADEPTTALDVTIQAEIVGIFDELRSTRGLSMLFITHDLELAGMLCDRVAVMYAGRVMEVQSASGLFAQPLHPYTRALLGSRPALEDTRERLTVIPGRPAAPSDAPPGCPFSPRCSFAEPECASGAMPLRPFGVGLTACRRAEDISSQLAANRDE